MRTALLQLNSGDDPRENLAQTQALIDRAVSDGAGFVLTPEVTNCVSASRSHQQQVLHPQDTCPTLSGLRDAAARHGIWLLIGSLALKTGDADGRFANRSFMINPAGEITARYDKMHMFDVQVSETETYRESAGYRPGTEAVLAQTPFAKLGLTICYDVRFPTLYRTLAHAGAEVLTVPSAFSPTTGAAHWESLLRARAIECGAYVLAPAQWGTHAASAGKPRRTHGHTMAVSPWGEVVCDQADGTGVAVLDLDLGAVADARTKIPSLTHDVLFEGP